MFKVMIVDDKKNIVEGMKTLIQWEKYGYQIVETVRSAKVAAEILENKEIDLCITDIRMPGMSGMELIEQSNKVSPNTKFIILSGYDEFEYAKLALEYHVCGYLLKPVDEEELISILRRVREEIENQKKSQDQHFWQMVRECLLDRHIVAEENVDGRTEDLRYISLKFKEKKILSSHTLRVENPQFTQWVSELEEILEKNAFDYVSKSINEREIVLNVKKYNNGIKGFMHSLKSILSNDSSENIIVFVGKRAEQISQIKSSRESVNFLLNVMFYEPDRKIFLYEDFENAEFSDFILENDLISECITAIKIKDEENINLVVEKLFTQIKKEKIKIQSVFMYVYNIIFLMGNYVIEKGGDVSKCLYKWSLIEKNSLPDLDMLQECFLEIAYEMRAMVLELKDKNILGTVGIMLDYINENYNDVNLNLQWLSRKYHITSSYLGRVFKQKFHMSFNKYLTKIRIEKAKELLQKTDYKVYEIARMVGYNDPNYFHVKFTEMEKITPAKYREKKSKE